MTRGEWGKRGKFERGRKDLEKPHYNLGGEIIEGWGLKNFPRKERAGNTTMTVGNRRGQGLKTKFVKK